MPLEYMLQIQAGLMITNRKWCDFVSYSNGMPMFVRRVERQDEYVDAIWEASLNFEVKVRDIVKEFELKSINLAVAERRDYSEDIDFMSSSSEELPL